MLLGSGLALAADDPEPEMELLEYLGMWEGTDEDWLIFDQPRVAETDDAVDSAAEVAESVENDDES